MEPGHPKLAIAQQCALLGLPRSTFYYQPIQESVENLELDAPNRRNLHAVSVLRRAKNDRASTARNERSNQPQARRATDARDGIAGDRPAKRAEPIRAGTQEVPVFTT